MLKNILSRTLMVVDTIRSELNSLMETDEMLNLSKALRDLKEATIQTGSYNIGRATGFLTLGIAPKWGFDGYLLFMDKTIEAMMWAIEGNEGLQFAKEMNKGCRESMFAMMRALRDSNSIICEGFYDGARMSRWVPMIDNIIDKANYRQQLILDGYTHMAIVEESASSSVEIMPMTLDGDDTAPIKFQDGLSKTRYTVAINDLPEIFWEGGTRMQVSIIKGMAADTVLDITSKFSLVPPYSPTVVRFQQRHDRKAVG